MTQEVAGNRPTVLQVRCEETTYPPYHELHGTPHAMLWRRVTIEVHGRTAAFEQTDYGHPGRLNAWEPRGIDPTLLPMLSELQAVVEAIGKLI